LTRATATACYSKRCAPCCGRPRPARRWPMPSDFSMPPVRPGDLVSYHAQRGDPPALALAADVFPQGHLLSVLVLAPGAAPGWVERVRPRDAPREPVTGRYDAWDLAPVKLEQLRLLTLAWERAGKPAPDDV